MGITIVTRAMDRLFHLEQTLPTWLALPVEQIIIVDWSSEDPLKPLIDLDKRITVLRINGQKYFNRGAAWNVGIKLVQTDWVLAIDADVKCLNPHVLEFLFNNNAYYRAEEHTPLAGTALYRKEHWELAGGYTENLPTWGSEDFFLYRDFDQMKLRKRHLQKLSFEHISHGNDLRMINQELQFRSVGEEILANGMAKRMYTACCYNDHYITKHGKQPMGNYQGDLYGNLRKSDMQKDV